MNQRGQSTVEVVLLAPLLIALAFLIFEFGRVFGSWLVVTNAAREGARFGVTQIFSNTDQCGGPAGTGSCTQADYDIQSRVANTVRYLSIQNAGSSAAACGTNNQPSSGAMSCIAVTRSTDANGYDAVTVLVRYKVQTLMPITGTIPFIGNINYPGFLTVSGLSSLRAE